MQRKRIEEQLLDENNWKDLKKFKNATAKPENA